MSHGSGSSPAARIAFATPMPVSVACVGAGLDPAEQHGADDPSPLDVAKAADRHIGRNRAAADDGAGLFDGHGGCPPQPYVLDRRGADDLLLGAHSRRPRRFSDRAPQLCVGACAGLACATCSTGCHSLRSGVITSARMFFALYCSDAGSTPILATNRMPSKSAYSATRFAFAASLDVRRLDAASAFEDGAQPAHR